MTGQKQPAGISVSIKDTQEYSCSKCGGKDFEVIYRVRTVSKLVTGTSRDAVIPVSQFRCLNQECKTVAEDLLPQSLKD